MTLEDRILAFALHATQLVMTADDQLDPRESQFIQAAFPANALTAAGFIDANGALTDHYHSALETALETLPSALNEAQKYDIIERLFKATLADDQFERREGNILLVAARILGLPPSAVDHVVSSQEEVGELELGEPEA